MFGSEVRRHPIVITKPGETADTRRILGVYRNSKHVNSSCEEPDRGHWIFNYWISGHHHASRGANQASGREPISASENGISGRSQFPRVFNRKGYMY